MISLVAFGPPPWRLGRSVRKILLDTDARFIEAVLLVSGTTQARPPNLSTPHLPAKALFVFNRRDKCLNHFRVNEVAIELIELV